MKALLAQLAPIPGAIEANADLLAATLHASPEADLAVFPELFFEGYDPARCRDLARPAAEALAPVARAAAETATAVVVGFAERTEDGTIANSVGLVSATGQVAAVYRKTQLSGAAERGVFTAGEQHVVVELAGHAVAPLNCFDVEFPEPARAVARAGAEVLVTVSANMVPYGLEQRLAVQARALENRRPHVFVNRAGTEGPYRFVGGSCVVNIYGEIIAQTDPPDMREAAAPQTLICDVPLAARADPDVDFLQHLREPLPVQRYSAN